MTLQYCTFRLDGRWLGIEVDRVREVVRHQEITRVPGAPDAVLGLLNLRGEVVPAIDLRRRFGILAAAEFPPVHIVVHTDGAPVSLVVDAIGEVVTVEEPTEEPPPTVRGTPRELIQGIHRLPDRLLMVLDVPRVILMNVHEKSGTGSS